MGPLNGIRVIEMVGIGPGPFCGMLLADLGAEVIAVDRVGGQAFPPRDLDIMARGKRSIKLDLKSPEGVQALLRLVETADVLFEGFRPGVMERLGVGPEDCMARNEKLIYSRMTGWGQTGPLAQVAGHDINYISLSGALYGIGRDPEEPPIPPLNLVGDYGGGGLMMAFSIASAVVEQKTSGKGQVIDVSMLDGSNLLMTVFHSLRKCNAWQDERASNFLDTGAPYYESYKTKDDKFVSVGPIEPQFYALLVEKMGLDEELFAEQENTARWPEMKVAMQDVFLTKTRDEWCELLEGTDACFAPVLPFWEAHEHPHNQARENFIKIDGLVQPAPAPKFSRTRSEVRHKPHRVGQDTRDILAEAGLSDDEVKNLLASGAVEEG